MLPQESLLITLVKLVDSILSFPKTLNCRHP